MHVSTELDKPVSEEAFEAMCAALYRRMWGDTSCTRMGGSGQVQFGVDILGNDGKQPVGIQCKHYAQKAFTLSTIKADVKKADDAGLAIGHLLFATTAPSKSTLVKEVQELSLSRHKDGKFTVSVDFWGDISGHIWLHPEIGKAFIPNFPDSTLLRIEETSSTHLSLYQEDRESNRQFQAAVLGELQQLRAAPPASAAPPARGDEADPRIATILDLARDRLNAGRSHEALELLEQLGDPEGFADQFSRFRWYTNRAGVALIEGEYAKAADMFIDAFRLAPDNEKAHSNRAHAYWLKKNPAAALTACEEGLGLFPNNLILWAVTVNARLSLEDSAPFRDVPEDILETPNLLAARAQYCEKQGDYAEAVNLLRRCLAMDSGSFDAKRAYLATTLSWAAHDQVLAHHGQIPVVQKEALADAIGRFEPLEKTLSSIQSDHISLEVSNNVAVSLMLLGLKDRALTLATHLLARHPRSEGLLRLKLNELEDLGDIAGIHALTDECLAELPKAILAILAEISANQGDLAWHSKVRERLQALEQDPRVLAELRMLAIHAQWIAGSQTEAIAAAEAYVTEHPKDILPRVMLGQMLRRLERESEALEQAELCFNLVSDESHSLEVLKAAELMYALRQFSEAGALYARLLQTPDDNEITRRLLVCLVESDQRRRAQDMLDRLAAEVRSLPSFRRIEANLARRMGDWARMRDILAQELARCPDDAGVAVGYVGALYRLGDLGTLTAFLAEDPRFKDSLPENEFELSKYLASIGMAGLAIARMYRVYRTHPASLQAASFYLSRVFTSEPLPELAPPVCVGPGATVYLKSVAETRVIAIDLEPRNEADSWPELISPDSPLAQALAGLKLGDRATIAGHFGGREVEVVKLASTYGWAAEIAHDQVGAAAVPAGPLWSVRLVRDDGEVDVDMLLRSAKQRKAHVRRIFESYKQSRFPLSVLAKAVGTDPVTLLREWPSEEASLFVGLGTHEEREAAAEVLHQAGNLYVLDLLTIAELVRLRSFDAAIGVLGRPLVPQTVREHLLVLLQLAGGPRGSATLGEQDGKLHMIETPPAYHEAGEAFLREMLTCINEQCEVVPTMGPQDLAPLHADLAELLDADTLDVLYLCAERGAVLVSEDGALRLWAPAAGVATSMAVQPVLMEALAKGLLGQDVYADAIVGKILAGHDFVSIRAEDLLTVAERTPARASVAVMAALESFRRPTLDVLSGVEVSREFLAKAMRRLRFRVVAEYGDRLLEVLQHERPAIVSDAIHRALAAVTQHALGRPGRRPGTGERKAFEQILSAPEEPPRIARPTPLALAIQKAFRRKGE